MLALCSIDWAYIPSFVLGVSRDECCLRMSVYVDLVKYRAQNALPLWLCSWCLALSGCRSAPAWAALLGSEFSVLWWVCPRRCMSCFFVSACAGLAKPSHEAALEAPEPRIYQAVVWQPCQGQGSWLQACHPVMLLLARQDCSSPSVECRPTTKGMACCLADSVWLTHEYGRQLGIVHGLC